LTTAIYVPKVGDPEKLAQFAALGLVPGQPFPGNNIPNSLLDSNVQLFLATGALPEANSGSQYITSANQTVDLREDILRIDEKVSDKIELMGHYMHDTDQQFFPGIFGGVPTVGFPLNSPANNAVIKMTYIFSPSLINVAAFNFNNDALFYGIGGTYKIPSGWGVNKFFPGNDPNNRMPTMSWGPPYNNSYQPGFLPYHNNGLGYTESDDLSWTKGAHNFKFGGSFLHYTRTRLSAATPKETIPLEEATRLGMGPTARRSCRVTPSPICSWAWRPAIAKRNYKTRDTTGKISERPMLWTTGVSIRA
jgi:hypothetical protein